MPGFAELSCSGAKSVDLCWNLQKQFLSPLSLGNLREGYNLNEWSHPSSSSDWSRLNSFPFCLLLQKQEKSKVYILDFSFYHLWTGLTVCSMVGSYCLFLIFIVTVWSKHGPRAYSNTANLILSLKKKGGGNTFIFSSTFFSVYCSRQIESWDTYTVVWLIGSAYTCCQSTPS